MSDNQPDPYWPEGSTDQEALDSTALFVAAIEACARQDIPGYRAIVDSSSPRDYATAVHFAIQLLNALIPLGVNPQKTLEAMRRNLNEAYANP